MRRALLIALVVLTAPAAASAVTPGAAAGHTPKLDAARAQVVRLDGERAKVHTERATLERRLDALAAEIARLKAHRDASAPLFTDPALDKRLKASQALSTRIDALGRTERGLENELRTAARRLLAAYDAALAGARKAAEAAHGDAAKKAALERLSTLDRQRREVAAGLARLSPDQAPADPTLPTTRTKSDDPEDLRAQADLLRDTRDRLARRLTDLRQRAHDLERQRDLENEMHGFMSETRLFDEGDRTATRVSTSGDRTQNAGAKTSTPTTGGADSFGGGQTGGTAPGPGTGGGGATNNPGPTNPASGGLSPSAADSPSGDTYFRFDREPTRAEASGTLDDTGAPDDAASLDQIEARMKRLEALIHRLDARARHLDTRAHNLDRQAR